MALLLLCLTMAVVALMVRSHWVCDQWQRVDRVGMLFAITSRSGHLVIHSDTEDHFVVDYPPQSPGVTHFSQPSRTSALWPVEQEPDWSCAGFAFTKFVSADWLKDQVWEMRVPDWSLLIFLIVLPAWVARRQWVRWRCQDRLCANCGYDLRATPHRCPECGAVPKKART